MAKRSIVVLAGGFGGSKMAHGFAMVAPELGLDVSIVVNTGDDLELHGLSISPDLDTVMYTLAGWANTTTGWGVRDETWSSAEMLGRYGAPTWFRLGDRDLATHLVRTQRLREGERLTAITAHLASSLGVTARILPMTDHRVRTMIRTADGWMAFQDWFVGRHHADPVLELRFDGIGDARPTAEALRAIASAERIVFAPSNPFVSIGTILAAPGMEAAIREAGAPVTAVSPIVGGAAIRGPADAMLMSLGGESSALGIARHYATNYPGLVRNLVIDRSDADHASEIEALGMGATITSTVMTTDAERAQLARSIVGDG
ncbi:MAG: 2-phospho-L-lactate transferase [Candidatus Limnocylindrales bacterium]